MAPTSPKHSLEDVLLSFAVEDDQGRETLERYLARYPEYTKSLISLSFDIDRPSVADSSFVTEGEEAVAAAALARYKAITEGKVVDIFQGVTGKRLVAIIEILDVPLQVLAGLRDRVVAVHSIPRSFLSKLARSLDQPLDQVTQYLASPSLARSSLQFKSADKPRSGEKVSFEHLLSEAGVPEKKRDKLISNEG